MAALQPDTQTDPSSPVPFEQLVKYIRVRSTEQARFVEFDFAIGDPGLFVELVLPRGAFEDFCRVNQVVAMSAEQMAAVDADMAKWRYGEDTLMAHNHDQLSAQLAASDSNNNN